MRGLIALTLALLVAGAVAMLAMRGSATAPIGDGANPARATAVATAPPGYREEWKPPEPPPPPPPKPDPDAVITDGRGRTAWAVSTRGRSFTHVVNGAVIPGDIRQEAGLSEADAALLQRETAAENAHIARALREFIATLRDFPHTADQVANADALQLMTWVAQYQPMHLEKAAVEQLMDQQQNDRWRLQREPWDEFPFPEDGLVMRFVRVMHGVREATLERLHAGGMDASALGKLRTRYFLDGHFRLEPERPFDFGRPPTRR